MSTTIALASEEAEVEKISPSAATTPQRVDLLRLSVSFKPETAAFITAAAALAGMTRTAFVRWIVEEWAREKRQPSAGPVPPDRTRAVREG